MGFLDALFKPKPAVTQHALKWPLPELRYSVPVDDAGQAVAQLKKLGASYHAGGTFTDSIYAKDFGGGAFAYFIVRSDDKTQNERLLFEGYMLQENEKLGTPLESGPGMAKSLQTLGYQPALDRHVTVYALVYQGLPVKVYDVDDFGAFIEIAVPGTKLQNIRDLQDKNAKALAAKFAPNPEDVIPTDVITLHFTTMMQQAQADAEKQQAQGGRGGTGDSRDPTQGGSLF